MKRTSAYYLLPLCMVTLLTGILHADVRLPNVLSDNMVIQCDKPIRVWGWAESRERVTVTFKGESAKTRADKSGCWGIELPPMAADAAPHTLTVKGRNTIAVTNVLVGEVWLCSGQSNMKWPMRATEHWGEETNASFGIRLCSMSDWQQAQPAKDAPTKWTLCAGDDKARFSGVGFHFGKAIHEALNIPVGLIAAAVNGSSITPWIPLCGFDTEPLLKESGDEIRARTVSYQPNFWSPASFYNGMISPLTPLSMRGIIWYQGESNCEERNADLYVNMTRALIKGWQMEFKQDDLPFYFVQVAPHTYHADHRGLPPDSLPRFWETQYACMQTITNTGMAVITDVAGGNLHDWHPRNKRSVGQRLARWALAKNYGQTNTVYSGPIYKSMTVEGDKAILSFDHVAGGLKSNDGRTLSAFTMAGADQNFWPAAAVIAGDTVEVRSPYVDAPVAVRFAWHETTIGNLCNSEGLPAMPFRTDTYLPFVSPLLDYPVRDASVCIGPDGTAYMTGTTGHPGWSQTNEGIRVWSSGDLKGWKPLGLVWSIETNGTWQTAGENGMRAIRAPEIHYIKNTFWLTYSMNYGGTGLLKSQSGTAAGPYVDVKSDGPLTDGFDASLFQDDDGAVYLVYQNGIIARMTDDMRGLAEAPQLLKPANAEAVGGEGAFLSKVNGRYCLLVADHEPVSDGRTMYHCMAATSDSLFGPYGDRYPAIPHAGQTTLFQDGAGDRWCTFSGCDDDATFRDRPGLVPIAFDTAGVITPLKRTTRYTPRLVIEQTLLPNASEQAGIWRYTLTCPPEDWVKPEFDDSNWEQGEGGFGALPPPNVKIGTVWNTGQIWLRRSFEIAEPITGIQYLNALHDEDARVYVNGVLAAEIPWFNSDYQLFPMSAEAAMSVTQGWNTIAVFCNQTAGGQCIDVGLVTVKK